MPTSIMQKNYSHCPLKKRPVLFVREDETNESEIEPENLSLKPEDLLRTGKNTSTYSQYAAKITKIPELSTSKDAPIQSSIPSYSAYVNSMCKNEDVPLNLSPASSPVSEAINLVNPIHWHKSFFQPSQPNYSPFINYPLPYRGEPLHMYSAQTEHSSFIRESSISPTYRAVSPEMGRNCYTSNMVAKLDTTSHRYTPYIINHSRSHHAEHNSLSPSSTASFSSYISMRQSLSPVSNVSSAEDLACISPKLSVLIEKTNTNYDASSKLQKKNVEKHGVPRYQCPACSKSYSTYSGLSKHQQFHCVSSEGSQAKKIFSCKRCPKEYASLGALKMHIRTHTLPCKCTLCGKAFSRPWLLQGHIRTHTGEKPFSCQHCHRAFADRSNLRAHLQTHSDVKKYSCQTCAKTFSRMSLLTKHIESGCPGIQQNTSESVSFEKSIKREFQRY